MASHPQRTRHGRLPLGLALLLVLAAAVPAMAWAADPGTEPTRGDALQLGALVVQVGAAVGGGWLLHLIRSSTTRAEEANRELQARLDREVAALTASQGRLADTVAGLREATVSRSELSGYLLELRAEVKEHRAELRELRVAVTASQANQERILSYVGGPRG